MSGFKVSAGSIQTVRGGNKANSKPSEEIDSGEWEYYVSEGGNTVDVIVATHNGNKYIKTTADGLQPDNLLSLPECP